MTDSVQSVGSSPSTSAALPPPVIPDRVERSLWWYVGAGIAALLLLAVGSIVVFAIPDPVGLVLSIIAAAVPAAVYVWIVLRLDPFEAEPRSLLIGAFGWGAVGAVFFAIIFSLVFSASFANTSDAGMNYLISTTIGAPLVEESVKGLALLAILLFHRHELDNILDGIVYGAVVGIGFAMTENILYFGAAYLEGGFGDLGELFLARAVLFGFGHAIYSATLGAAIGWSREQYARGLWRFIVPILGWALAVFQHLLWNGGVLLISGLLGEDVGIIQVVLVGGAIFILPAVIVLFVITRIAHRRELRIMRDELEHEVRRGTITLGEYEILFNDDLRRQALRQAGATGDIDLRKVQQRFFEVAAELAFREYHLKQGEILKPGQRQPDDVYRQELARLRAVLAPAGLPGATAGAA